MQTGTVDGLRLLLSLTELPRQYTHLLLEEIIPRYSTPLQIVTDNGSENINRVMKHALQEMDISPTITLKVIPR